MALKITENIQRIYDLYDIMRKSIPDEYNMLEVIRAAEFILADCIAQSGVSDEVKEKTFASIPEDVKAFEKTFREEETN